MRRCLPSVGQDDDPAAGWQPAMDPWKKAAQRRVLLDLSPYFATFKRHSRWPEPVQPAAQAPCPLSPGA